MAERALFVVAGLVGSGCGSGPGCPNIAGTYQATFSDSCASGTAEVSVTQNGCAVTFDAPGFISGQGRFDGDQLTANLTFPSPCLGDGFMSGTFDLASLKLSGSFSGQTSCCAVSNGLFTMSK